MGIQTPIAQGRYTKIISMIKWIRTSRLLIQNSVSLSTGGSASPACQAEKRRFSRDNNLIHVTRDNSLIHVSRDNKLMDVARDNNLMDIPRDNKLIHVSRDNNLILVPRDNNLIHSRVTIT